MVFDTRIAPSAQVQVAHARHPVVRVALCAIALTLGAVSVALAAYVGASRGIDLPTQVAWGAVGGALALGLLLAPSEVFACIRRREWAGALAAALLAVVCAGFVLTGALGNAAAGRQSAALTSSGDADRRDRAERDHDAAQAALASLAAARAPGEIKAEAKAIFAATPGLDSCEARPNWRPTRRHREACQQLAALDVELARSRSRAEIEAKLATARAVLDAPRNVSVVNSDASAVAKYLAAFGVSITAERVGDALVVVAVAAIEFGGALALTLARSSAQSSRSTAPNMPSAQSAEPAPTPPSVQPPRRRRKPENRDVQRVQPPRLNALSTVVPLRPKLAPRSAERVETERVMARITEHVQRGDLPNTQRAMAALIGASIGTLNAALTELSATGAAVVTTTRRGTVVRLSAVSATA